MKNTKQPNPRRQNGLFRGTLKFNLLMMIVLVTGGLANASEQKWRPEFSTAGFYQVDAKVREASNFNVGWRFFKGDLDNSLCIPKNNWKVLSASSQELDGESAGAANLFDGNKGSFWHSKWQGSEPGYPHELVIDLGKEYPLKEFVYTARNVAAAPHCAIKRYELYLSTSRSTWGDPVLSGELANQNESQTISFEKPVKGRYVRFRALSPHQEGSPSAAVAEFDFLKDSGTNARAEIQDAGFDDSEWPVVNLPHGLELVPQEASGSVNYQGVAWYRKHFDVDPRLKGKKVFIHFEAIMGKSEIWVNGKSLKKHFGGFLPIHVDVSDYLNYGGKNVIAVKADNSNDPAYPPGKPQEYLDFTYFGGIYRDVWMVTTEKVYITNANAVDKVAGGGVFVHFEDFAKSRVKMVVDCDIRNESGKDLKLNVELKLVDKQGKTVGESSGMAMVPANSDKKNTQKIIVDNPHLWHVNDPYLHKLYISIKNSQGRIVDSFYQRIGIRKVEFHGRKGLFLNNEPIDGKLIGGNRHQDFAYIGNALPNATHWRDAKKLRDAAMRVIRCAHYPQDPAFMDACDELGLLMIVATPGWQFWNNDPRFGQQVIKDIRNMVRRDRNHPCVMIWESALNESHYPKGFAKAIADAPKEEYPYQGCYTACDAAASGQEYFDIIYEHPIELNACLFGYQKDTPENRKRIFRKFHDPRPVFNREWGDCPDDWNAQNSPSRISKAWGEAAQLVQAMHYSKPDYIYNGLDSIYYTPEQFFGGCLWHSFDHQRGYHPDPFYGGIMDAFRQPKYSYYMFKSQMPTDLKIANIESKPFIFVAHEMSPASGPDVTVFSNCDEVRLSINGKVVNTLKTSPQGTYMPHVPVVFKDVFDIKHFLKSMVFEGLIEGEVVTTYVKKPSMRRSRISLRADSCGIGVSADGSDIISVVATFTDQHGVPKRLTDAFIKFEVEGEGTLIDDERIAANPQKATWGEAVALVRTTEKPGKIRITASSLCKSAHQPKPVTLEIESQPASQALIYSETPDRNISVREKNAAEKENMTETELQKKLESALEELNRLKLKEVEDQQGEFAD